MTEHREVESRASSSVGARYRGADLRDADFRHADVRHADFRGADLRRADFSHARTGTTTAWSALLLALSLAAALAFGIAAGFSGRLVRTFATSSDPREQLVAATVSAAILVFASLAVWRGMQKAVRLVLPTAAGVAVLIAVAAVASGLGPGRGALGALLLLVLVAILVGFGALARAVAGEVAPWAFVVVAVAGGLIGGWVGGGATAAVIAITAMLVGRRSIKERAGFDRLTHTALRIACSHGTRFDGADLRGASFDGARLERSSFRGARLDGAPLDGAHVRSCLFDEGAGPRASDDASPSSTRSAVTPAVSS